MIRTLALLLLGSLCLAGCSSLPKFKPQECTVEYRHTPLALNTLVLPAPLDLPELPDIHNVVTHWEISHDDFAAFLEWQHEIDRYNRDLRQMLVDIEAGIEAHNKQHSTPEEKQK